MAGDGELRRPLRPPPKKAKKSWVDWLVAFRWIIVVPIVLPISFCYQCRKDFSDWWSRRKSYEQKEKEHQANVQKVQDRLKSRDKKKDGLVCTARKPWLAVAMRNSDYKRARRFEVELNDFSQILNVDTANRIARCEPYVSMGQLSAVTVPLGYALEVVPELDDLTVGGLINGYGIEGSSHIYGLFQDTVAALEIVLGDGTLVRATKDNEYSDLFYAVPWSQGTIGLLVAAEIRMIPVGAYMRVTYKPVRGDLQAIAQAYSDSFVPRDGDQDNPAKVPDFVEAMVYNKSEGVMMTGRYADREEAKRKDNRVNECGWWWKPWFYQHAQTALKRGEFVEYIPTREYYHRHTRSMYWEGKLILPFGDQLWFRFLFGWMMPPKVSFLKMTQGEAIRQYYHDKHVIQDVLVPLYKVGDLLEVSEELFEVYPIWMCPHRIFKTPVKTQIFPEPGYEQHRRPGDTDYAQMYTDVGIYYAPGAVLRGEEFDGSAAVAQLEDWMIQNHSFQPQYAVSELSERDFWRMFDRELYFKCREKYGAVGTFMSVYYKSKKGKKTEQEVRDEEQKVRELPDLEAPLA
eukprot:jgi/Mesen1/8156/ME000438S07260